MEDRAVRGTSDWTRHEIVLDVPMEAATLNFGLLLDQGGQVWMDSLAFEVVANDVPVTGHDFAHPKPPQNLTFDKPLAPIGTLRTIVSAQALYKQKNPDLGYACEFAPLVAARALSDSRPWAEVMDGYKYSIECPNKQKPQAAYRVSVVPVSGSGPTYCSADGVRLLKAEGGANACFDKGTALDR